MKCLTRFVIVAVLSTSILSTGITASSADLPPDPEQMELSGIELYKKEKKKFDEKKLGQKIQKALNSQVGFAIFRLKRRGTVKAVQYEKEWKQFNTHFEFLELGINNIEDHDPALIWLDDFYKFLVNTLGEKQIKTLHLDDIDVFNRGIPVVFKPKTVEKPDYNDCFVRVSKGIGYWTIMLGCTGYNYLGSAPTMLFCGPISSAGRFAFGILADPVADAIWDGSR